MVSGLQLPSEAPEENQQLGFIFIADMYTQM